jgi:4'-phosphopantetheinyl transferase
MTFQMPPHTHEWPLPPTAPTLSGHEVHVWRAALDLDPRELSELSRSLSADERRRAAGFRFDRDRRRFIAARGTLRLLLGLYLGVEPHRLGFRYGGHGKPALTAEFARPSSGALHFNLSHSEDVALYAFARGREVGVDIEYKRAESATAEVARTVFSAREMAALGALPRGRWVDAFFACWARKEAYLKACGQGLSLPTDQFDVTVGPDGEAALLETRNDAHEAARWSLRDLSVGPTYAATVAVEGRDWELKCWRRAGSCRT